jgi:hypothetical protein
MKVKGTALRSRIGFLRERFGEDSLATVLEGLDATDRKVISGALPGSWIPFEIIDRFEREIIERFGGGHDELAQEFGAFSAKENLTTLYKIFIEQAQGDPHSLFENLSNLHRSFYDCGDMRALRTGDRTTSLEVDYEGSATRPNCLTAVGFYSTALEIIGVAGARVEERACQAEGAKLCRFEIRWDES